MIDSKPLFTGRSIRVTLDTAPLPDGRVKTDERAHRADVVHILAFNAEGEILLLREYRAFYESYVWMIPSGHVDKESDIVIAAHRELREETGFRAGTLEHMVAVRFAEKFVTQNHFFIARELTPDPLPQDDDELMEVHPLPLDGALEKLRSDPVIHLPSEYAILKYLNTSAV